jgi:hypothetical protein
MNIVLLLVAFKNIDVKGRFCILPRQIPYRFCQIYNDLGNLVLVNQTSFKYMLMSKSFE